MSMKNSSDTIGNQSRDLQVCSAVPQTLRHRVPPIIHITAYFYNCIRHLAPNFRINNDYLLVTQSFGWIFCYMWGRSKCLVLFTLTLLCKVRAMSKAVNRPRVSLKVRVWCGPNQCKFVVQAMLWKQGFLRVLQYFLVSITIRTAHTHVRLNTIPLVTEGKEGEGCEPWHKAYRSALDTQYFHFWFLRIWLVLLLLMTGMFRICPPLLPTLNLKNGSKL
jgi:hypothetical protein